MALWKLVGDRIKSNIDVIIGETIRLLSCRSVRSLTFRFPCNLFLILRIKEGFCNGIGGVDGFGTFDFVMAAAPVWKISNGMLSGSRYARIFSRLLASGHCTSRSRS